ncbi:MAG: glycosyltransferase [Candidatus Cybelea sp.]|jgi:glycosyltransferase involved in cell wall biosynthesis
MTQPTVRFSVILPTLNEATRLPAVLESIARQRYPRECVELLIADGGSTDETVAIAQSFGAKVFHNSMRRAEPGVGMLFGLATGDVGIVMAADNRFGDEHALARLALPFADPQITAAFPAVVSTREDGATARYINAFTDPFNHFVYGGATSPASYHRTYRVKRREPGYVVYDFRNGPVPLIALAQAFAVRLPYAKPSGTDEDDVAPVGSLILQGCEIAFVPDAYVEHHTVSGIGDALAKFGPRIRKRMTDGEQPVWQRLQAADRMRRLRAYLWPFYGATGILPAAAALYGWARDGRREWLYHPFVSAAFAFEFWKQLVFVALERVSGRNRSVAS